MQVATGVLVKRGFGGGGMCVRGIWMITQALDFVQIHCILVKQPAEHVVFVNYIF